MQSILLQFRYYWICTVRDTKYYRICIHPFFHFRLHITRKNCRSLTLHSTKTFRYLSILRLRRQRSRAKAWGCNANRRRPHPTRGKPAAVLWIWTIVIIGFLHTPVMQADIAPSAAAGSVFMPVCLLEQFSEGRLEWSLLIFTIGRRQALPFDCYSRLAAKKNIYEESGDSLVFSLRGHRDALFFVFC